MKFKKRFFCLLVILFCFNICSCSLFCKHIESDWIIDIEATVDNTGTKHTECEKCGKIMDEGVIPIIEYTLNEAKEKLKKSIVKVYCYDFDGETILSQGTGFFINETGKFITNAHVVEDTYYIKIKTNNGTVYDVNYMLDYESIKSDYAICIASNCFSTIPVEFDENSKIGDTVYALGYPNDSFSIVSSKGEITYVASNGYIHNTAKISPGSSGGVLLNTKGRVLGITTGLLDNNKYGAISYSSFKDKIEKKYISLKKPIEWFHKVEEVMLCGALASKYFDVNIKGKPLQNGSVENSVSITIKPEYSSKKIKIESTSINFSIIVYTTFNFYRHTTYFGGYQSVVYDNNSTITIFSIADFGTVKSEHVAVFNENNKYSDLTYEYSTIFLSASGTIVFVD